MTNSQLKASITNILQEAGFVLCGRGDALGFMVDAPRRSNSTFTVTAYRAGNEGKSIADAMSMQDVLIRQLPTFRVHREGRIIRLWAVQ